MKTTRQHHDAITRFLDRLKHRARWLLAGLLQFAASPHSLWSASLRVWHYCPTGRKLTTVAVTVASVGLFLVAMSAVWPLRGRWSQSQSRRHQARQVEARLPGLRGRLVTVVDRFDAPGDCAPGLLARAANHAERAMALV